MEIKNNGNQALHKFDNGYGASVVSNAMSYGGDKGLYELAVIKFDNNEDDSWSIDYESGITDDVIGHLTENKVQHILTEIEAL
jgi:hypothetical protein